NLQASEQPSLHQPRREVEQAEINDVIFFGNGIFPAFPINPWRMERWARPRFPFQWWQLCINLLFQSRRRWIVGPIIENPAPALAKDGTVRAKDAPQGCQR